MHKLYGKYFVGALFAWYCTAWYCSLGGVAVKPRSLLNQIPKYFSTMVIKYDLQGGVAACGESRLNIQRTYKCPGFQYKPTDLLVISEEFWDEIKTNACRFLMSCRRELTKIEWTRL